MVEVRFLQTASGRLIGFLVTGHANARHARSDRPHGKDIVCAAVSALSITAANALKKVAGIDVYQNVDDGFLDIQLPKRLSGKQKYDADIILRTARLGLRQIADQYPRHVTMNE